MRYHQANPAIIVDPQPARRATHALIDWFRSAARLPVTAAWCALALGTAAAIFYSWTGLALNHYDAKAHLVVARRVIDSITPGWLQIGAVWLPLPHLLSLLPVQIDLFYRTGAFTIGVSVLSFAAANYLVARIVLWATSSRAAAAAAVAVLLFNPDVLYLQATPMTEPLLIALTLLSVWWCIKAFSDGKPRHVRLAGLATAAAFLTRYEAWPATAAVLGLGLLGMLRTGLPWRTALGRVTRIAIYPACAFVGFLLLSRATVGAWFVDSGFFVAENPVMGHPFEAMVSVWWATHSLTSYPLLLMATAGALFVMLAVSVESKRGLMMVPLALIAVGLLPSYAFFEGHPFRIRYMIPLIPAMAVSIGMGIGLLGRLRPIALALAVVAIVTGPRPFDAKAPMVLEAQWDTQHRLGRAKVTAQLVRMYDGQPIMASMGSLAHYMQELSHAGFDLRAFLHEGNGDIWLAAIESPYPHVGWILIEEQAEGGDMLAALARKRPSFLEGFSRVAEGGGVALYRRDSQPHSPETHSASGGS